MDDKYDPDLDLYIKKKLLVEDWRDDLPYKITELCFRNNRLTQICFSLVDYLNSEVIDIGVNTYPKNLVTEDKKTGKQIFNWKVVDDFDSFVDRTGDVFIDIEVLKRKKIEKDVDREISYFVLGKHSKTMVLALKIVTGIDSPIHELPTFQIKTLLE